ncbi:4Fe-4S binding protein [Desulfuribacillus stibiiarsenatis]|nr:4Fe-4S binding protein [Desulfuribacillus stibiiarsenatis]
MRRQVARSMMIFLSFLLFPVTMFYLSPAIIIEGAFHGVITGSFIVFGVLLLTGVIFGRAFCGWLCPGAGLQECCQTVINKTAKGGKLDKIKYFIWIPWLSAIIILLILAGGIHKVNFFYQIPHGISIAEPVAYIIYYFFIGLIVLLAFLAGRRAFCHYVCWMAPFIIIGTKIGKIVRIPQLHLIADKNKCNNCKLCNKKCQMSLHVEQMVQQNNMSHTECILCGECVDGCNRGAIQLTLGTSKTNLLFDEAQKHDQIKY